eukprot:565792-Pyramimonas_sp.AAC.1
MRDQPLDRIPTHGRWGRMFLAAREVIFLCMSAGINDAFPGTHSNHSRCLRFGLLDPICNRDI